MQLFEIKVVPLQLTKAMVYLIISKLSFLCGQIGYLKR